MALPIWQRTITTEAGDVIPGAEVEVVNEATGLAADIFSNRAGTTPRTNPFFTGANGFAQFYAAPGEYRITATGPTGSITWRWNVLPGTAAAQDVEAWRSTVTVTGNHTVTAPPAYGTSVVNVDAATGTITLPPVVIGGRILVRKINATQGEILINADGTDTITRAALSSVTLNADGDNWLLEKVSGSRWELIAGVESGENSDGEYWREADGKQTCRVRDLQISRTSSLRWSDRWTFPSEFVDTNYTVSHQQGNILGVDNYPNDDIGTPRTTDEQTDSVQLNFYKAGSAASSVPSDAGDISCQAIATGRWYE